MKSGLIFMNRMFFIAALSVAGVLRAYCSSSVPRPGNMNREGRQLVWHDEFNSNRLDTVRWKRCYPGKADWCRYMSTRPDLVEVRDGMLVMKGVVNSDTNKDSRAYLTGGVRSAADASLRLGKAEIRAKFEDQKGAWPALWMCGQGTDSKGRGWPWNGEIDIVERLNKNPFVYQTLHSGWTHVLKQKKNPDSGSAKAPIRNGDWNIYGIEITQDAIIWSVNDKETFRYPRIQPPGSDQWPFNREMFFIMDMQLGGGWVGEIDPETLPVNMYVDWIRVWSPRAEKTADATPVMQLRLRAPDITSDEAWNATRDMIAANPGCCDEVWFSTGIGVPPVGVHSERASRMVRAAAELRRLGIVPSLQFQATIGHGDKISLTEDCSAKTWRGWTGSTGVEAKACNCPRQSGFLDYVRSVASLYAAVKPAYVWIDDDLRFDNHSPATIGSRPGCWCEQCIADFNALTGGKWTRKSLDAAVANDTALMKSWIGFSEDSVAEVARAIAEEFRRISPDTRMALQHGMVHTGTIMKVLSVLHETSGKSVGFRPGGGAYYDVNPNDQIIKSLYSARCRQKLGDPEMISVWTPEVESWPRVYGSRSAQSILVEGFSALMYGMDAVSMLVTHTGNEERGLYSRTILKPLADGSAVLNGYAKTCKETIPVGFTSTVPVDKLYAFASSGVPVLFGIGRACGELTQQDLLLDRRTASSRKVQELRNALDGRGRTVPALVASPFVGLMLPRVSKKDGKLRTVALLNNRIDAQEQVELVLRGVQDGAKAVWRELRHKPVVVPLVREGSAARATISCIGAWNAGYLELSNE